MLQTRRLAGLAVHRLASNWVVGVATDEKQKQVDVSLVYPSDRRFVVGPVVREQIYLFACMFS